MTCESIRITWYDVNNVAAVSFISRLSDFAMSIIQAIPGFRVEDWMKLSHGFIVVDELQIIEDSVAVRTFPCPGVGNGRVLPAEFLLDNSVTSRVVEERLIDVLRSLNCPYAFWKVLDVDEKYKEVSDNASSVDESADGDSDEAKAYL